MRIGYLECFAGISGDMLLGALVHAGVPAQLLQQTAASLGLEAILTFESVDRSGIAASKARVLVRGRDADAPHSHSSHHRHSHGRTLPAIRDILRSASLPPAALALALRAFELLGEAEAAIHNVPLDQVHFHEVGAIDAIVDIACAAAGLASLEADRWYCSAINVGGGFIDCAHGRFPVPAPATAALLRGLPTYSEGPAIELATPTGAAILRALDCAFRRPAAAFDRIGYGAGSADPARFPNVLRFSLGEAAVRDEDLAVTRETVAVLECAIDDLSPQVVAHALQLALDHGALDAMASSVVMKKGRLGALLTLLCRPEDAPRFEELLFTETSTLGIRSRTEQRRILDRAHATVTTPYGEVRIKTATLNGALVHAQPEYEDCRAHALASRVPLKRVIEAAAHAWSQRPEVATTQTAPNIRETVTNEPA